MAIESKILMIIGIFCFLKCVYCLEFEVGDRKGWVVPPANDTGEMYNEWASKLRFKVGDTIRFKYKKDSVNKKDYNECNSNRPNFFSNTGSTSYTLDRSGFFYFVSGVTGHCQKGQRMIVWVMGHDASPSHKTKTSLASHSSPYFLVIIILVVVFPFVY